jgi:hypothetical protein
MHVMDVEGAVCGMATTCWFWYIIIHQPILVRFLLQQNFLRGQNGMLCVRNSCILSMYSQYTAAAKGQTFSSHVLPMGATQGRGHPSIPVCCGLTWQHLRDRILKLSVTTVKLRRQVDKHTYSTTRHIFCSLRHIGAFM